jgi:hypothetical protein
MWNQHDFRFGRRILALLRPRPLAYPQPRHEEDKGGGKGYRSLDAKTAGTIRGQRAIGWD